jgi:CheY-like chemotaxis protein
VFDCAAVVAAAVDSMQPAAGAKGICIASRLPEEKIEVLGDARRVQRAITNLIGNALKFSPPQREVRVALRTAGGLAVITVEDDGIGIETSFLPHVFERFRQADERASGPESGIGLGLAIVREIVELHGGSVKGESEGTGRGAKFSISLPCEVVGRAPGAKMRPRGSGLDGLRVLVVDDERDSREMLAIILGGRGASVVVAASAEEATEALESGSFDLLISDVAMPGEDGHALIRAVRGGRGGHAAIPAIAISAHARAQDREASLSAGFAAHLVKPIGPDDMLGVITRILEGDEISA